MSGSPSLLDGDGNYANDDFYPTFSESGEEVCANQPGGESEWVGFCSRTSTTVTSDELPGVVVVENTNTGGTTGNTRIKDTGNGRAGEQVPSPQTLDSCLDMLKEIPDDKDPYEYVKQLKKSVVRTMREEVLMSKLTKFHITKEAFNKLVKSDVPDASNKKRPRLSSAPNTSSQVFDRNADEDEEKLGGSKQQEQSTSSDNVRKRQEELSSGSLEAAFSNGINPFSLESLSEVEAIAVRLKGSVDFAKTFLSSKDTSPKIVWEVKLAIRTVNKCTLELVAKGDLEDEKNKLVLEAVSVVSALFMKFVETVSVKKSEDDVMGQLGIRLIVSWLVETLTQECDNSVMGCIRGNFAHEIVDRLKSIEIRSMILSEVLGALKQVLNRLSQATRSGKEEIINYSDVHTTFRLLQIIEFMLVTSDRPWVSNDDIRTLTHLETTCQEILPLMSVQIFLSRVVTIARKKEEVLVDVMDVSLDED